MHPLVELAKRTVEAVARGKKPPKPELPEEYKDARSGVFVSLKMHGDLRGCIGTFLPVEKDIASEIVRNAIAASTEDPRFEPVIESELGEITYSVDVLSPPEPVDSLDELDPKRYGVIVSKGHRRGLLLPDLEGVDTVQRQLEIAMMKAGLVPGVDDVSIQRFEVRRYK